MADGEEQSAPAEAPPAPETPAAEPAPPEPVATVEVPEASALVPEPTSEVVAEVVEPISQQPAAEVNESTPQFTSQQTAPSAPQLSSPLLLAHDLAKSGLAARRNRKEVKIQKILDLVKEKGTIGSTDVQKYLHVADSTATRYLNALVVQGKLRRTGPPTHARYLLL